MSTRTLLRTAARRSTAAIGALALGAGGIVLLGGQAQAAGADLTCAVGSQTADYSPALTNTPTQTTASISETYSCTSLLTGVTSGTGSETVSEQASCLLTVAPDVTDTFVYQWNTGQSSTVTFSTTSVVRAVDGTATITSVGSVTAGLGLGSAATRVVVLPSLDLAACASTGIATQTGTAALAILPI